MKLLKNAILISFLSLFVFGCTEKYEDNYNPSKYRVRLNVDGLKLLSPTNGTYSLWTTSTVHSGTSAPAVPIMIGEFNVDENGVPSPNEFTYLSTINSDDMWIIWGDDPLNASYYALTFTGDTATFSPSFAFPGLDLNTIASSSGSYFLGTPTDGNNNMNEQSGIWFGDLTTGLSTLTLPQSTGEYNIFVSRPDGTNFNHSFLDAPTYCYYCDIVAPAHPFPGVDYLLRNSLGDLSGATVRIYIQNSGLRVAYPILETEIAQNPTPGTIYPMTNAAYRYEVNGFAVKELLEE